MGSTDDLEITPFKEFMYLPVGRTLMRISQFREMIEEYGYPTPIIPMRSSYVERPELLDTPHVKKIQEDELICQMVLDQTLQEKIRDSSSKNQLLKAHETFWATEYDASTEAVQPVWKKGIVTMRSVFASRL